MTISSTVVPSKDDTTSDKKVSLSCLQHAHDVLYGAYTSHSTRPVCMREHAMWSPELSSGPRLLLSKFLTVTPSHTIDEHMTDTIIGMCVGVMATRALTTDEFMSFLPLQSDLECVSSRAACTLPRTPGKKLIRNPFTTTRACWSASARARPRAPQRTRRRAARRSGGARAQTPRSTRPG